MNNGSFSNLGAIRDLCGQEYSYFQFDIRDYQIGTHSLSLREGVTVYCLLVFLGSCFIANPVDYDRLLYAKYSVGYRQTLDDFVQNCKKH